MPTLGAITMTKFNGALAAAALSALALAAPTAAAAAPPEQIVQFAPGTSAAAQRAAVRAHGGRVTRELHIISALGARLSHDEAAALAADDRVVAVSANASVRPSSIEPAEPAEPAEAADALSDRTERETGTPVTSDPSRELEVLDHPPAAQLATSFVHSTRTNTVWEASTGRGVGVAVVDTGIAGDLPDFRVSAGDPSSRVIASAITNPNATTVTDRYGHGTHVAGLIAGNGAYRAAGDPQASRYAGTAPNANLINVKVSDDHGAATLLDVITGLQFVVDHRDAYGIRVVNLSLNSTVAESSRTDPLDAAVEQAWLHGIVVVTAAGNLGTRPDAVSYAPANDPYAIAVGAVDDAGTKSPADDRLASWSSRGVTQDGFAKPEIVAPGAHMVSTLAPDSDYASLCPSCVRPGGYFQAGGTSMAAPVVAGIVADLLALHPDWTPDQVKGALVATARGGKDLAAGEVNAARAATAAAHQLTANQGLTPNTLIEVATGSIDYTKASWSKASWSTVADPLKASWSKASWSCANCGGDAGGAADPSKASWSKASWSKASWSTAWGL